VALRGALAALGLVLAGWPMAGLAQTVIAPDVAADRALGTTVGRMGPVFTIGGGTRVGGNLFHSFARFDLAGGDVARWVRPGDAATIANVINRVTGGQASHISGTIDSTGLPNATFYFINPAGIVFGPGAQVNVPAAAHFSTASDLRLADGNRFAVATPSGSTLSVAPPEAWGFLGGQGAIDIQGVDLHPEQTTLHFTGAHVSVGDSRFVTRGFDLIAVGDGPAAVRLADPLASGADGRVQVGNSQLSAVELTVGGRSVRLGGGVVDIQASSLTSNGNLFVTASERLETSGVNFVVSSVTRDAAGVIALRGPEILLHDTRVVANAVGDGAPGRVLIEGDQLTLSNVDILADARDAVGALPGLVQLRSAGDLMLRDSMVRSNANGVAAGGVVSLEGRQVVLDASAVESDSLQFGDAGRVTVKADTLRLTNASQISSTTNGRGLGGDVLIDSGALVMDLGSSIRSDTLGSGKAGSVAVAAQTIDLAGDSAISSRASAGTGDAGEVHIQVGRLTVTGSRISSGTSSVGDGGLVDVHATDIVLDGGRSNVVTGITSESLGAGDAGDVSITADTIAVGLNGRITTSSRGAGRAGEVQITATGSLTLTGGAISSAADVGSTGGSGTVDVAAGSLTVQNGGSISTLSTNPNPAGVVTIQTGTLLVDGSRSLVNSENQAGNANFGGGGPGGGGDAGGIDVTADNVTVSNGGRITTNSFAGAAGDIDIAIARPGLLILEGAEAAGVIQTSSGPGTGGKTTIRDPLAIISNGGSILALGQQRGANVLIQSRYFINSTDRANVVDVDGDVQLQTGLYDVSSGMVSRDLSVLDASKVLRGQCPAARSTGAVSQLITRPVGPYARESAIDVLGRAQSGGGCP
jgi:filamentous hemagglutinin family protein